MAEAKNTFTRSKMNQDLDDRLLPSNEYRRGDNIVISQSNEGEGALEIIKGNTELSDLGYASTTLVEIIGVKEDPKRDKIYCFVTDYRDSSSDYISNPAPSQVVCAIIAFNIIDSTYNVLVSGNFLNFSKLSPIINIDVLEDLLFWTDDRNQPRVINIETALTSSTYYSHEDHISVAKYYPWKPIEFTLKNVSDEWQPIYAYGHSNAIGNVSAGSSITWEILPRYGGDFNNFASWSTVVDVYMFNENNPDKKVRVDTVTPGASSGPDYQTYDLTLDEDMSFGGDDMIYFVFKNPLYNAEYEGDKEFFEEKFLKFSYRFKYQDNTYSLIAPFTQTAFIPKNDGYFSTFPQNDIRVMMDTTENPLMTNKVDLVELKIKNPGVDDPFNSCTSFNEIIDNYKVDSIEIIVKDADKTSLQVIDTIQRSDIQLITTQDYVYNYTGTSPFQTLPESETVRVFDQVPARAKTQASSGNRIMYGNIVKRKNHPKQLSFGIETSKKYVPQNLINTPQIITPGDNIERYPNHSLKQNRTYKAGIVLVDRYGRQSSVITGLNNSDITFTQDTVFSDYLKTNVLGYYEAEDLLGLNIDQGWFGDSMKLAVREQIPSLQNGSVISSNPYNETGQEHIANDYTGWMTYKIVVQQREQDYYNVYHPGFFNGGYKVLRNTLTKEENALTPIIPQAGDPTKINGEGPQDPNVTTGTYTVYGPGSPSGLSPADEKWMNGYQSPSAAADDPQYIGTGERAVFKVVVTQPGGPGTTPVNYEITALEGGEGFKVGDVIFIPWQAVGVSSSTYGDLYLRIRDFVLNEIFFEDPSIVNTTGVFSTQSDNLNKVPKDITDVGPVQSIFNSDQILYARVTNAEGYYKTRNPFFSGGQYWPTTEKSHPWYPSESHVVNRIGTGKDLGMFDTSDQAPDFILNGKNNPFLAGVKADSVDFGVPAKYLKANEIDPQALPYIGVYETKPFESNLDIYYESSTSGTIKELNETIADELGFPYQLTRWEPPAVGVITDPTGQQAPVMYLSESDPIGKNICSQNDNSGSANQNRAISGIDQVSPPAVTAGGPGIGYWSIAGTSFEGISTPPLSSSINIFLRSVLDGYGNERKQDFNLVWPIDPLGAGDPSNYIGRFYIQTTTLLTCGADFNTRENYTFYIVVEDLLSNVQIALQPVSYQLGNVAPIINSIQVPCGASATKTGTATGDVFITQVNGLNGAADPTRNTEGLTFAIDSTPPNLIGAPYFYFTQTSAGTIQVYARQGTPAGVYTVTYTVTDAPGVASTCVNTITIVP